MTKQRCGSGHSSNSEGNDLNVSKFQSWKDDETNFYDSMAIKATEAIKEDVKRAIKVFQKL